MVDDGAGTYLRSRFLEGIADVTSYTRGAAHASTIGRQLGLSREEVEAILRALNALGLIEVEWMSRTISLTPLGQLRAQHG